MRQAHKNRTAAKKNARNRSIRVATSSGNVFADLGLLRPDLLLAKAKLVQQIRGLIAARKLTQAQAAELLGLDQPKVSALVRGRVEGYSLDRLFRFLNLLGQRIEITVRSARNGIANADTRVIG